jgi:hydroxyacylglutathione hydrolase
MDSSVIPVPTRSDNYVHLLLSPDGRRAAIVDPSDAGPVRRALNEHDVTPVAILNTHHHGDHVGGNQELQKAFDLPVFGAGDDRDRLPGLTHPLHEGDTFTPTGLDRQATFWLIPGHTRAHGAFLFEGMAFVGDTLFVAGCGRLFEGSPAQMRDSLDRLASLPDTTQVYCAHEYTLNNLRFAAAVEPDNPAIAERQEWARARLDQQQATVPSTIADERATNPFLRIREPAVARAAAEHGADPEDPDSVFAVLRDWKDRF